MFVKNSNGAFFADDMDLEFTEESYYRNMNDGFAREAVLAATAQR